MVITTNGSSRVNSSRFANATGHAMKIAACTSNYARFKPHRDQCARFIENSNITVSDPLLNVVTAKSTFFFKFRKNFNTFASNGRPKCSI